MADYTISPSKLQGETTIPPSKSQTLRAILFGMLGNGKTVIHNYLASPDTDAMIQACRLMGTTINHFQDRLEVIGSNAKVKNAEDVIHAGNSGLVLRFISAIAALSSEHIVITGDLSIRTNRPIQPLLDGLSQLGALAISTQGNGYAPVIIKGPLQKGTATISGEDSQPVSAILIASAFVEEPIQLKVVNPGEKPWVGLTLSWFDRLGIPYKNNSFMHYSMLGSTRYDGFEYHVPGDLSSAAFPIAAAIATRSELTLNNVDLNDAQGDKQLITVLQQMGASIEIDHKKRQLHVHKSHNPLQGVTVDINDFIDALPILGVIGCFAEGTTHITNGAIARQKECDRIHCLAVELKKMGANITELDDGLRIEPSVLHGTNLHSHHDHRMAMSLIIAALAAKGPSKVQNIDCIAKTYPDFLKNFKAIGANIQ